jgi:hypothetical protein
VWAARTSTTAASRRSRRAPAAVLLEAGQDAPHDLLVQLYLLGRLLPFPGRLEQAERLDPRDVPRVVVGPVQQRVLPQLPVPAPACQFLLLPFLEPAQRPLPAAIIERNEHPVYGHPVRAGHRVEILNHPPLLIVETRDSMTNTATTTTISTTVMQWTTSTLLTVCSRRVRWQCLLKAPETAFATITRGARRPRSVPGTECETGASCRSRRRTPAASSISMSLKARE